MFKHTYEVALRKNKCTFMHVRARGRLSEVFSPTHPPSLPLYRRVVVGEGLFWLQGSFAEMFLHCIALYDIEVVVAALHTMYYLNLSAAQCRIQ